MKIIFFGNGLRGEHCLKAMKEDGYDILAAIGHLNSPSLVELSEQYGIPLFRPKAVNDRSMIDQLKDYQPDLFVLAGYNQILKKDLIHLPLKGAINLHGGKLPEYRGVAPINWQIINNETIGGCCILYVDEGIDTGDIIEQTYYRIDIDETAEDIINKQLILFPKMLLEAIDSINADTVRRTKQDPEKGAYYTRRYPKDGKINWRTMTAIQIHNLIRALNGPYPPAYCHYKDEKVNILRSRLLDEDIFGVPGRIAMRRREGTIVIAHDKGLMITKISKDDTIENSTKILELGDDLD